MILTNMKVSEVVPVRGSKGKFKATFRNRFGYEVTISVNSDELLSYRRFCKAALDKSKVLYVNHEAANKPSAWPTYVSRLVDGLYKTL
jgi:hypothetical protein